MRAIFVTSRLLSGRFGVTCILTFFTSIVFQIYPSIHPSIFQFNLHLCSLSSSFSRLSPPHRCLSPHRPTPHLSPSSGCYTSSRTSPWTLCRPTSAPCSWTTATLPPGWIWARCTSPATSRTTPSSATSTPHAARAAPTPPRSPTASNACRWVERGLQSGWFGCSFNLIFPHKKNIKHARIQRQLSSNRCGGGAPAKLRTFSLHHMFFLVSCHILYKTDKTMGGSQSDPNWNAYWLALTSLIGAAGCCLLLLCSVGHSFTTLLTSRLLTELNWMYVTAGMPTLTNKSFRNSSGSIYSRYNSTWINLGRP